VKFFNEEKGFGMITDDATGQDIFVSIPHKDSIREGDNVVSTYPMVPKASSPSM